MSRHWPASCGVSRHWPVAMFPAQRGKAFYEKVLTGVGAITPLMSTGFQRLDFRLLEMDSGVGDCFKFVQNIGQDDPAEKLPEMCWIGGVSPTSICHSSKQRHDVLEKIVQEALQLSNAAFVLVVLILRIEIIIKIRE